MPRNQGAAAPRLSHRRFTTPRLAVLVCGGRWPEHSWARADAPRNAPGGPWLQCGNCGWWTRPEDYRP